MIGHIGMEERRRFLGLLEKLLHFLLPTFKANHLLIEAVRRTALEDKGQQRIQFAIDFLDFCLGGID
ncbi:hypothetical protein [Ochrobactrum quorumnocens]|uniref:hypothetical protein n=1 Tax=Ochrobactrum quorumnocens TaxID=271865 RepID=UPI001FD0AF79|nr:hypothetical protein [[Ochrobactrum] quorumnocens]